MITVLIMAAAVMLLGLQTTQIIEQVSRGNMGSRVIASRDSVLNSISFHASFSKSLIASTLTTNALKYCVYGLPLSNNCVAGPTPMNLTDEAGTLVAGPSAAAPVRYDLEGNVCTVAGPRCPIEAFTTFTPTCAVGPPCDQAVSIRVDITLRQAPGVQLPGYGHLKNKTAQITTTVAAIQSGL